MQRSTKEIAKEAVEAEFRRAGKRRKRNVDSSDDEVDDRKKRGRRRDSVREPSQKTSELEQLSGKYRDRVKERREGIHVEEDVAAVRFSVQDQLFNDVVGALESGNREKLANIPLMNKDGVVVPNTFQEALTWISNPESKPPHTQLGTDVLSYLQKAYLKVDSDTIRVSAAGRNVQQSVWTFTMAINADPRDRVRSWEIPWEQTFAYMNSSNYHDSLTDENVIEKACACSPQLISQMLNCFAKRAKKEEQRSTPDEVRTSKVHGHDFSKDDDDDDIFENVGEYHVDNEEE